MNFGLILFVLSVITFIAWLGDKFVFAPARRAKADAVVARLARGDESERKQQAEVRARIERQPWYLEYTAGLFPVIIAVFCLRSFVAEPFKIPTGSMIPTLLVGDLILVNKFSYGVRLPVIHTKILDVGSPQRGDTMVFRYPKDPSVDYIKRVVAIGGDKVEVEGNRLSINGKPVELKPLGEFFDSERLSYSKQYSEVLGTTEHKILTDLEKSFPIAPMEPYAYRENCTYTRTGVSCTVPAGHFFVMGDNRENSLDSRFWGFVPEANIVGRAFFIWMNLSAPSRIGSFR
jgi:signal peptidase I